jgi:hypothetical protein
MNLKEDLIKAKLKEAKIEIDSKSIVFEHLFADIKINIQYSQKINQIIFKGKIIEIELINAINQAIEEAKINFEKEMFLVFNDLNAEK